MAFHPVLPASTKPHYRGGETPILPSMHTISIGITVLMDILVAIRLAMHPVTLCLQSRQARNIPSRQLKREACARWFGVMFMQQLVIEHVFWQAFTDATIRG